MRGFPLWGIKDEINNNNICSILDKFIAESVTSRPVSMFAADIEANRETLSREIKGEKVCLLGDGSDYGIHFKYA